MAELVRHYFGFSLDKIVYYYYYLKFKRKAESLHSQTILNEVLLDIFLLSNINKLH